MKRAVEFPGKAAAGERGIALVMALMVLLAMSLLSVLLMVSLNVETKIAGHSARHAQALNVAEAGVSEVLERIRVGDVPNNMDPRMVAQIFLAPAGSVPVVGADTVALPTAQPAGQWLDYSTATKTQDVLTVQYRTDSLRTLIHRYDPTANPPIQSSSGFPIFRIQSTGKRGQEYRRIVADVIQRPFNVNMKGALAANVNVFFTGEATICGYNHRMDTPTYKGEDGRSGVDGCNENPALTQWELPWGSLTGLWTTGDIGPGVGAQNAEGTPDEEEFQAGFYAGPWEALGMTQAEFYQFVGPPKAVAPNPPEGILHLDNNAIGQDQSGSYIYNNSSGSGFLYVDGDLTLNGEFSYRGLIYVEGDVMFNGRAWILGGLIVRGKSTLINNGEATLLYSADAINLSLAKAGGRFVTLAWRELARPQ
jgi:Tfp pilus assembly protein PilX